MKGREEAGGVEERGGVIDSGETAWYSSCVSAPWTKQWESPQFCRNAHGQEGADGGKPLTDRSGSLTRGERGKGNGKEQELQQRKERAEWWKRREKRASGGDARNRKKWMSNKVRNGRGECGDGGRFVSQERWREGEENDVAIGEEWGRGEGCSGGRKRSDEGY